MDVNNAQQNQNVTIALEPMGKWNGYQKGLAITLGVTLAATTISVVACAVFASILTTAVTATIGLCIGVVTVLVAGKYLGIGPFKTLPEVGVFFDREQGNLINKNALFLFQELKKQISDVTFIDATQEPRKKFKVSLYVVTGGGRFGPTHVKDRKTYEETLNKQRSLNTIVAQAVDVKNANQYGGSPAAGFKGHFAFATCEQKLVHPDFPESQNQQRMKEIYEMIHDYLKGQVI